MSALLFFLTACIPGLVVSWLLWHFVYGPELRKIDEQIEEVEQKRRELGRRG